MPRRTAVGRPHADRTGSLESCVSYSYAHLSEATRRLLPLASLFQGVVDIVVLLVASGNPDIPSRFAGATSEDWVSAIQEAVDVGLLTRPWDSTEDDYFGLFLIHPALPGYLASMWRADSPDEYDASWKAATRVLVDAHHTRCRQALGQLGSRTDSRVFSRVEWARPNLSSFLGYALDNGMWAAALGIEELLEKSWDAWGLDGGARAPGSTGYGSPPKHQMAPCHSSTRRPATCGGRSVPIWHCGENRVAKSTRQNTFSCGFCQLSSTKSHQPN